jgi:excisionase family DNA binding protein
MSLNPAVQPAGLGAILDGLRTVLTEMRSELANLSAIRQELQASHMDSPANETRAYYSVEEAAKLLGKSSYTVRQWANEGRINATKRVERRGCSALWSIPAGEIERHRNEGLLPLTRKREDRESCS